MANYSIFDQLMDRRSTNSLKWSRYPAEVLPMWVADMDFAAPEPAREVLHSAIEHGVFGYEMPTKALGETVAARLHRLYGWRVSPEMVLATPGVVAGFNAAARAVCAPGEGVLVQPPVYAPFLQLPAATGLTRQLAPLRRAVSAHILRYEWDAEVFRSALNSHGARTAMFLLCQPHNPTGHIFSEADIRQMAEVCMRNDIVLCSDEIHSELLLGGAKQVCPASLAEEIAERTITLFSPSKTFNLVGLFCGFAVIPNRALRARYQRVLHQQALHVNSLGLLAAQAALSGACDEWLEQLRTYLTGNRDYVVDFVARQLPGVRVTVPQATYLAWLDFEQVVAEGRIGENPYQFLLENAKVALNPGGEFGKEGEKCVRLNFGCPRATLIEGLERIRRVL
jgi:cystathionine beta-lyase